MEGEQETSSSKWVLKFCGEIYATSTSTSEMRPIMRNLIMKNRLKKTRDHYKRKLKGLWTKQNWSYVYFDHDHVRSLALFPCLPHFYGSKGVWASLFIMWVDVRSLALFPCLPHFLEQCVKQERPCIVHHVSGCQMDIGRKEHLIIQKF